MIGRQEKTPLRLFTIIVSVVVLLIMLLLVQPFFSKMLENFERTTVQQIISQLNTAANFKMAEYVALDKLHHLPEELNKNPVTLFGIDDLGGWERYRGEVEIVNFEAMDKQTWFYERLTGRLIYRLAHPDLVENNDPVKDRLQFRLVIDYNDLDKNGKFTSTTDTVNTLLIQPVYGYRWLAIE